MNKRAFFFPILFLLLVAAVAQESESKEYLSFEPNVNILKSGAIVNGMFSYTYTSKYDYQTQQSTKTKTTLIALKVFGGTSFHTDFSEESDLKSFLLIPYSGTVFIGVGVSWIPKGFMGLLKINSYNYFSYFEGDVTISQASQSIEQSYFHSRSGIEIIPIRKEGIDRFSIFLNVNIWQNGEYSLEDDTSANPLEAHKYFDFGFKLTGKLGERSTISLAPNFILTKDLNDHFDSNFIEVIRLYLKIPISK